MIDKIEFLKIFNPETHNFTTSLAYFRKNIPKKLNLEKKIKYGYKDYSSINLLEYYKRIKENTHGINIVLYNNVLNHVLLSAYINNNFTLEVIKDRNIIFLNEHNNIKEITFRNTNVEVLKNNLLVQRNYIRYGLFKVKWNGFNMIVGGDIDTKYNNKFINIALFKKLSYRSLLELYFSNIFINIYKVLYTIINNDGYVRYYNSFEISKIPEIINLDLNKSKIFFKKVIEVIKKEKKRRFILKYINNKFIIEAKI